MATQKEKAMQQVIAEATAAVHELDDRVALDIIPSWTLGDLYLDVKFKTPEGSRWERYTWRPDDD